MVDTAHARPTSTTESQEEAVEMILGGRIGYEHLHRRILPLLRDQHGVGDDVVTQMMVENPRRLLDRP